MKNLACFIFLALVLPFACTKAPKLYTHPGIEKGRPDPVEEKQFIKRYAGYLGSDKSIPLELLLVNWGNGRLSGHTTYPSHEGVLNFEGNLKTDGSFLLAEERFYKRNASFVGQFDNSEKLSGTWWNIDSSQSMPFEYYERKSEVDYGLWEGVWHLNDPWDTATLIIGGITERRLEFAMNIYINDYTEQFYGTAKIDSVEASMKKILFDIYGENCDLIFHRNERSIYIEERSFPYLCGLGDNCWINRNYDDIYFGETARINFIGKDSVFRDTQIYLSWLETIGKENEMKFAYNMERLEYLRGWEKFHGLEGDIWKGRVRGFHRHKEGIIAYNDEGHIWTATTTPPDSTWGPMKVHYFTNVNKWRNKLPVFIYKWFKEFKNCTVVFESGTRPEELYIDTRKVTWEGEFYNETVME